MDTENSIKSEPRRFKLDLTDKRNLKNPNKNMALANLSIYYASKNIKSEYNNNKFKIEMILLIYLMVLTLLLIFKNTLNLSLKNRKLWLKIHQFKFIQITSKKRTVFKIKTGYKLELLTPETVKLLGSTKKDDDKDKDGEIVTKLESVEVVLVHCNLVKNDYQHTSKVTFSFVSNKQFGHLINISPHSLTMMNTPNFLLLKFGLQIKLVKHLKLKIVSIWR